MKDDSPDMKRRSARRRSRLPALSALVAVVLVVVVMALVASSPEVDTATTAEAAVGSRFSLAVSTPTRLTSPLPADALKVRVPILMYHYVDDTPPPAGPYADGLTVRTNDFVAEMNYLVEGGYHTVSLADVYLAMAGEKQLPEKPVALTFDDGGLDNYEVAFPLLKEYGLTGTFFVITGSVGKEGQMDWDMLREMASQGMSIQSHTVSHPDLRGVSESRLASELADSRSAIEEVIGEPSYVLAYPSGAYDGQVIEATRAAGYVMAVATDKGKEGDPAGVYEMRRRRVQAFLPLTTFAKLVR
jgi:peptidoglycan/xylan/chitin deacetylase (PgdA/CDA1 family)